MRSSICITAFFAALAVASPVHKALQKKAYVYDIVTEIVTITVTAGDELKTIEVPKTVYVKPFAATTTVKPKTRRPRPTTSKAPPPPPPAPTTTTPPPPPPPAPTTKAPQPTQAYVQEPKPVVYAPAPIKVVAPVEKPVSKPPPTAAGPSSSTGNKIMDAAINVHNQKRALHGVGPVTWDAALASSAAALSAKCVMQHEIFGDYGQNLYSSSSSVPNAYPLDDVMTSAVNSWYDESKQFGGNYGKSDVSNVKLLHFTQLVWKATTKIGCAVSYCPNGGSSYYVTCNYAKPGNFGGQYAANVLPPV